MKQGRNGDAEYCAQLVKANDLDRYLSTLLADKEKHRALLAIYAFDADVATIDGQVSEPGIGEIRLQWWRDEIDAIYGGTCDNHPIARELQLIVDKYDLPKHLFTRLVDARRFDIYREPMANVGDLMDYLSATSSATIDLASRVLISYDALEIERLIGKAGIARGLGKLITSLPQHVARKQCFLPGDLLRNRDASHADVLAGYNSTGVKLVITQLCHLVAENLNKIRIDQNMLTKSVLPAFYPAGIAEIIASRTAHTVFNPLKNITAISQFKMQVWLFKKSFFEEI